MKKGLLISYYGDGKHSIWLWADRKVGETSRLTTLNVGIDFIGTKEECQEKAEEIAEVFDLEIIWDNPSEKPS